jgi:phage shock protein A
MIPGKTGMSGAANDLAAAQARQSSQSGTSALSGYVDDVSESVQQLKAELGDLSSKLSSAKTQAQQRKITGQMRNIQDEINLRETSRISGEKDNFEYDLGLD